MLSVHGRKPAALVVEPVARILNRTGITPNTVTVAGALITILIAVLLIPSGHLVWAAILSGIFAAFDMVDGTMARMRGGGTKFGATLDATCDRITDGALFAAITWWLIYSYEAPPSLVVASLVVLISSQVISYVKARGEASGFRIVGGLVERPERLILGLVGVGLQGFGVPYAIDVAIWLLTVGSVITVVQRLRIAARAPQAQDLVAAPEGAAETVEK
ncbi:CDP-diacylglycerol--inositol 3-phosphatidyltransferase [Corynebacterium occultum]|uniref:Phosphatidylinositol phosphate synthase n=1 Tax=Corynebacterium occultum TaxID=2675219 RepID=A0A6B8WC11_9CORY|nr:CDP-alcohol phosphatidyltransferase family protein [Corynebacterium occultum]QGU07560.1 CDP-diacylglycerol--inositol 3-phosphatidyltransferase [Corynebacterium occultum]